MPNKIIIVFSTIVLSARFKAGAPCLPLIYCFVSFQEGTGMRWVVGLLLLSAWSLVVCAQLSVGADNKEQHRTTATLVSAGPKRRIYDPSVGSETKWYVNDHTFIVGPGGTWHLYGITHTEPADPTFEVNFAHATLNGTLSAPFTKQPFALGTLSPPETHLWAPHVVERDGVYHMLYCGGGVDRTQSLLRLAVSTDLWDWQRVGTLFTGGVDGRDPMALPLPPEQGGGWAVVRASSPPNTLFTRRLTYGFYARLVLHRDYAGFGDRT